MSAAQHTPLRGAPRQQSDRARLPIGQAYHDQKPPEKTNPQKPREGNLGGQKDEIGQAYRPSKSPLPPQQKTTLTGYIRELKQRPIRHSVRAGTGTIVHAAESCRWAPQEERFAVRNNRRRTIRGAMSLRVTPGTKTKNAARGKIPPAAFRVSSSRLSTPTGWSS